MATALGHASEIHNTTYACPNARAYILSTYGI